MLFWFFVAVGVAVLCGIIVAGMGKWKAHESANESCGKYLQQNLNLQFNPLLLVHKKHHKKIG